ncbi:MAG: MBL fold metallo-hydrolase [Ignavibacteriales bacterium]|nr:MBL fold metallo-hydrolase [Ignavibacteriales bacterium]
MFVGLSFVFLLSAFGQQDLSKVEIQNNKLSDNIYMLVGAGGNIGVCVGDDGVFVIDDQFAPLTEKIKAAVAAITPKPVKFVINTHWHGDHVGGNENMGKGGAIIVAHDNVRKRMSAEQVNDFFKRTIPASPKDALPVITFTDATTFYQNGEEINVFHVRPAHTDGDAMIYFRKANVLHMGDTFFVGYYPIIDIGSGGSIDGMIAASDKALSVVNEKTKIIPGHGSLSDMAGLRKYRTMLATVRERVKKLIDAGKMFEEVKAAKPLADYDEEIDRNFVKPELFLQMVYTSLTRK